MKLKEVNSIINRIRAAYEKRGGNAKELEHILRYVYIINNRYPKKMNAASEIIVPWITEDGDFSRDGFFRIDVKNSLFSSIECNGRELMDCLDEPGYSMPF